MKPFLLIQSRPEDEASDNEYQAFLRYTDLTSENLQRFRIEQAALPAIALSDYSGIFIGGGPFNFIEKHKSPIQMRIEDELRQLLETIYRKDFPLLGACYGIGLCTSFFGGGMSQKYAEPVGATTISKLSDDPLLEGISSEFTAFLGHKEACESAPRGSAVLARSVHCPVQMMRLKQNIYATQFHPELDFDGLQTRVNIYKYHGYFKPEEAESLIEANRHAQVTEPMKILKNFVKRYQV